jgi:hypothetical protein
VGTGTDCVRANVSDSAAESRLPIRSIGHLGSTRSTQTCAKCCSETWPLVSFHDNVKGALDGPFGDKPQGYPGYKES